MEKKKKVFILEGKIEKPVSGYDHVFSFRSNPADSFPDDYLSVPETDALYDQIYDALTHYLENHPFRDRLTYRGVDLLWCFKKVLFEYAYLAAIRFDTLKKVKAKMKDAQIYISRQGGDLRGPLLVDILKASDLHLNSQIRYVDEYYSMEDSRNAETYHERQTSLPSFNILGNISRCKVASCYDFDKAKSLLNRLRRFGCIIFSFSQPRRTILRALFYRFPICQAIYKAKIAKPYLEKTNVFLQILGQCRLFQGLSFNGLDLEPLLADKIKRVFVSSLPKLLFEIDCMNLFFAKAKALKSVLLDEDISPNRRAFCSVARTYGVRTFVECHGLLGGKHGFIPPAADKIFVWGEEQKKKLIRWGCPQEKIIVSGYSRYDRYLQLDEERVRKQVAKKIKLDPSKKIILVAFPPITHSWFILFENRMRKLIEETLEVVAKLSHELRNVQFVLKLHPADHDKKFYWGWAKRNANQAAFRIVENYDSLLLAKAVDFLIVLRSTYAVDGFAMNKPVIYLRDDSQALEEFRPYGIFLCVSNNEELEDAVRHLVQNTSIRPGRWEEARRDCLNETGASAEDFIISCLTDEQGAPSQPAPRESTPANAGAPFV